MIEFSTIMSIKSCLRGHSGGRYAGSGSCKECRKASRRAQYAANPEEARAANRAWYAANLEKRRANARALYAANPEKDRAYSRARSRAQYAANPEKTRANARAKYAANPEKVLAICRALHAANKLQLVEHMGGRCADCALTFHQKVYDFHHIDPSVKDPKASRLFKKGLIAEVIEELKKCVMLCANCHRLRHASLL